MSKERYKIVHIFWHDSAIHGRHSVGKSEVQNYGIIRGHSVGILVGETKEDVTIATDMFPESPINAETNFRCLNSYPKSGIEKMTVLKIIEIK